MSFSRHFRRMFVIIAVGASAAPAVAQQGVQDTRSIDEQIALLVGAGPGEPGGARSPIDPRIRLAGCPETLEMTRSSQSNVTVSCRPLGWAIRVPLLAGGGNDARDRRATLLVTRGDQVRLVARRGTVRVTMTGVALDPGGEGDRIRIRIGDRRAPIAGYVLPGGDVSVDPLNASEAAP